MKFLVPVALAASLAFSGAAFAANTAPPAGNPAVAPTPAMSKAKPIQHHLMVKKAAYQAQENANRETQALNLIEARGYGPIRSFRNDGKLYDATVMQNGKAISLQVDPDNGRVTHQG
jgi:hypothetical protein